MYLENMPECCGRNNIAAEEEPPSIDESWSFTGMQGSVHLKSGRGKIYEIYLQNDFQKHDCIIITWYKPMKWIQLTVTYRRGW